ncbi:hypothetical protein B0J18DRAFT_461425 [Chaetomium sp. MPI-SDFR-AT-0129]|nr:hypothetical protein B0J18DRAFT_461425 [Chaetomium sp. MPI-SDFR-AT-0129]
MAPAKFERFFDLPGELREHILSHVCVFPTGIWVGGGIDGRNVALRPGTIADFHRGLGTTRNATNVTRAQTTNLGGYGADASTTEGEREGGDGAEGRLEEEEECADPPVNLFLASPVLYREAGDLYYGRNVFYLDFASNGWSKRQRREMTKKLRASRGGQAALHSEDEDTAAANVMMADVRAKLLGHPDTVVSRRRIRSVVVDLRRLASSAFVVSELQDMVLNGALERIRVNILEAGVPSGSQQRLPSQTRGRWLQTVDYAENPALRALLVLLTDPNLERAQLGVPVWEHAWFWCSFHEGAVPGCAASATASAQSGQRDTTTGDGFFEVQIPRLVSSCVGDSAEFRIKKVGG